MIIVIWYQWHPRQKKRDLNLRWFLFIGLSVIFIALLYTRALRCILTLAVPSMASSRGRALIIAFAFFVAAIGPTANILANLMVMLRSLACGQELLRQVLGQMLDVILEPIHAIQTAISLLLNEVRRVLKHIMEMLLRIQAYLMIIINTLKNCAAWLRSIVELCNTELGTPWQRCQKAADRAMNKCRQKLGIFRPLCYATKIYLAICYPAKIIDVFCSGFWDQSWELLDKIMARYYEFVHHIEQMFDVNITFEHDFYFETNSSKNLSDVGEEIIEDIRQRLGPFVFLFGWLDLLCWLMLLTVFIKAIYFYARYMHSRKYQNKYLTGSLYWIDRQRQLHGEPTVMPLKRLERLKYIKINSCRLTRDECFLIAKNTFFMVITCVQLFTICFVDYSLFWLLATMSYYGHQQADLDVPAYMDLEIKGGGFIGDIMRGMANAFRPLTQRSTVATRHCLPLPREPNYWRYWEILALCIVAWLIGIVEPYALRLRHVIMRCFYPERAHVRALYLHNKILTERVSFFKFARRKARAAFMYQDAEGSISFRSWLNRFNCCGCCWCLACCFCLCCGPRSDLCVVCAKTLSPSTCIRCDTKDCPGLYCQRCFSESNNKCCLCKRPIDYGDYSDFSDVQDSSNDSEVESFGHREARLCYMRKIPN
ncbi:DC-STAMP domain-containing protein 2 [Drosophila tropicalis]|uniref:DC-STAMP domain-containing protein 2 n=1 Tax=Drosophila tropicalis TaxID=46794 RepID=UPI0035ABF626